MSLHRLGVHPGNRGGVYPQGDVVKQLCIRLGAEGYSQEKADHLGVSIQEAAVAVSGDAPTSAVADGSVARGTQYNQIKCHGSQVLSACFGTDAVVTHGMLTHNHLLLVLLCWLNNAVWELTEAERKILAVGSDGRLNLEAAVAVTNLQELHTICQEGLMVEVLSWKMEVEPGACVLVSNALNNSTALALTELTAVAVLSGECALHSNALNSDSIDYEAIKAKLQL